jgi:hypothetical protein
MIGWGRSSVRSDGPWCARACTYTVSMHALKNQPPLLPLVPPCLRFLSLACLEHYSLPLSLSLRCRQASRRDGAAASAWPQHERATIRRIKWPSTRRRNGAGPNHGRTSAAGPAWVAPQRIWLPLPVVQVLPSCHITQPPSVAHRQASAYKHRRPAVSDKLHVPTSLHSPK